MTRLTLVDAGAARYPQAARHPHDATSDDQRMLPNHVARTRIALIDPFAAFGDAHLGESSPLHDTARRLSRQHSVDFYGLSGAANSCAESEGVSYIGVGLPNRVATMSTLPPVEGVPMGEWERLRHVERLFLKLRKPFAAKAYEVAHVFGVAAGIEAFRQLGPRCQWVVHVDDREIAQCETARLKACLDTASKIFVTSEASRLELNHRVPAVASRCHARFKVVRNDFLDVPSRPAQSQTILYVGESSPDAGLQWLLHAFGNVIDSNPQAHLNVVETRRARPWEEAELGQYKALECFGPEILRPKGFASLLAKRVASLGPGMTLHKQVARREVAGHYARAGVFVCPAIGQAPAVMAVVEAMAAGLPVIASRQGVIPELVRHNQTGLLVEPANIYGYAAALKALLDRPELRARMGAAGRELAKSYFTLGSPVVKPSLSAVPG